MSTYFPPSAARLLALSGCAALWILLHVKLALRERRQRGAGAKLLAWVPGAGAVMAWREGARFVPVLYVLLVVVYVAVWVVAIAAG